VNVLCGLGLGSWAQHSADHGGEDDFHCGTRNGDLCPKHALAVDRMLCIIAQEPDETGGDKDVSHQGLGWSAWRGTHWQEGCRRSEWSV